MGVNNSEVNNSMVKTKISSLPTKLSKKFNFICIFAYIFLKNRTKRCKPGCIRLFCGNLGFVEILP